MSDPKPQSAPPGGLEWHGRKEVARLAGRVAQDFRDLADRIDREAAAIEHIGERSAGPSAAAPHGWVASQILAAVLNGLNNTQLNQLTRSAAEAPRRGRSRRATTARARAARTGSR